MAGEVTPLLNTEARDEFSHLAPTWENFIQFCRNIQSGEIGRLKIEDGLPLFAEEVRREIRFGGNGGGECSSVPGLSQRPPTEDVSGAADDAESALRLARKSFPLDLRGLVRGIERRIITQALVVFDGNKKAAAKMLGLKYTTLSEKIKRYRIHSSPASP